MYIIDVYSVAGRIYAPQNAFQKLSSSTCRCGGVKDAVNDFKTINQFQQSQRTAQIQFSTGLTRYQNETKAHKEQMTKADRI